jgi:Zn-dependent protease with chaperone function
MYVTLPCPVAPPGTVALVPARRPAALAANRVARAGALLGALATGSSLFVVSRVLESWRVGPIAASHSVSVLGRRLSYPAANLAAIVVLALAVVGLAVIAAMVAGAVREVGADRRLRRSLAAGRPRPVGGALIIDDARPRAFCAGLFRPRVYVSSGAVGLLDASALRAVLEHERHHARRRDPLRLACGRFIIGALLFVPGRKELERRQRALTELSADESAIGAAHDGGPALARAMLSFSERSQEDDPSGIDPERVDHLLGDWHAPSWRFPATLCAAALAVVSLLLAIAALAGRVASGSATLAPPFLSRQPCVVVLALIPILLGSGVIYLLHYIVDNDVGRQTSGPEPRHQDRRGRVAARRRRAIRGRERAPAGDLVQR